MKQKLLIVLILILSNVALAQTEPATVKSDTAWKKGSKLTLSFSQVSFSNWAAGGENSSGGNGFFNLFAKYKEGNRMWDNNLDLAYGLLKLEGQALRKSEDKIDFYSKYGLTIAKNLYFSTNFNFNTQFLIIAFGHANKHSSVGYNLLHSHRHLYSRRKRLKFRFFVNGLFFLYFFGCHFIRFLFYNLLPAS